MAAAYALSFLFALIYGYKAARSRRAERVLLPILDVLQTVPILSFLPVAVLGLAAFLPERFALELAAIILIFSSQAWNMTFSWYQSLITIPTELQEASTTFRFHPWLRFRTLELPFAAIHLTWNSMMSWAGGWFSLMAAEMFTVGARDFRLVGLGSYLQEAAHRGDLGAWGWGLGVLVAAIVLLDQLVWRPALAWADRFKVEMVEGEAAPRSWFHEILKGSRLRATVTKRAPAALDKRCGGWSEHRFREERAERPKRFPVALSVLVVLGGVVLLAGAGWAGKFLASVPGQGWGTIALGAGATLVRVACALAVAVVWTVPLGVVIGLNRRAATWLQRLVQIAASIPATALFPVLVLGLVHLPGGLNLAAVLLMLAGTQWYLLFNVIAGVSAIPQDLKHTAALLGLSRWQRWRVLLLPVPIPRDGSHHRQRWGVERDHRGRIRNVWWADDHNARVGRADLPGHSERKLPRAVCRHPNHGRLGSRDQPLPVAAVVPGCRGTVQVGMNDARSPS